MIQKNKTICLTQTTEERQYCIGLQHRHAGCEYWHRINKIHNRKKIEL